jgi:hypothetical protein
MPGDHDGISALGAVDETAQLYPASEMVTVTARARWFIVALVVPRRYPRCAPPST